MDSFEAEKIRAWETEQELEQLKTQIRNPQAPPQTHNTKYTPPTSDSKTKKKYLSQELEQLKAQMRNRQSRTNHTTAKYTPPINDKNKVFYKILEIKPGVSQTEIKQAYKNLVKKWHPDLFFNNHKLQLQAQEKFKKLNEAYKQLSS